MTNFDVDLANAASQYYKNPKRTGRGAFEYGARWSRQWCMTVVYQKIEDMMSRDKDRQIRELESAVESMRIKVEEYRRIMLKHVGYANLLEEKLKENNISLEEINQ